MSVEKVLLPISECNDDPTTCLIARRCVETALFIDIVVDNPSSNQQDTQAHLRELAASCIQGTCPGRNFENTRIMLESLMAVGQPPKDLV